MKSPFIIGLLLLNKLNSNSQAFTVDVFDYNYSVAYSVHYHLTNDSINIIKIGELKDEHPVSLLQAKIKLTSRDKILILLESFSFSSLKSEYKNDLVEDGDQKRIITRLNGHRKMIDVANVYNEVISKLFDDINETLEEKFKIHYKK